MSEFPNLRLPSGTMFCYVLTSLFSSFGPFHLFFLAHVLDWFHKSSGSGHDRVKFLTARKWRKCNAGSQLASSFIYFIHVFHLGHNSIVLSTLRSLLPLLSKSGLEQTHSYPYGVPTIPSVIITNCGSSCLFINFWVFLLYHRCWLGFKLWVCFSLHQN